MRRWPSGVRLRDWLAGYARGLVLLAAGLPESSSWRWRPGAPGLQRLTRAIAPDIALVLHVHGTHLEHFGTASDVAEEKGWMVRRVRPGGLAILNSDDDRVRAMAALTEERVVTFGTAADADLRAEGVTASPEASRPGSSAGGSPVELSMGGRSPRPCSVRSGCRTSWGARRRRAVSRSDSRGAGGGARLAGHRPALRQLRGRRGSTVLDDSYNASPEAVDGAARDASSVPRPLRAVLGEMRELGPLQGGPTAGWVDASRTLARRARGGGRRWPAHRRLRCGTRDGRISRELRRRRRGRPPAPLGRGRRWDRAREGS